MLNLKDKEPVEEDNVLKVKEIGSCIFEVKRNIEKKMQIMKFLIQNTLNFQTLQLLLKIQQHLKVMNLVITGK